MSNDLFVRSYPAPGVEVVPIAFGAGLYGYFLAEFLPVSAIVWFWIALYNVHVRLTLLWYGLAVSVVGFFLALAFLRKLKLDIRLDGVSYMSPFRGDRFLAYRDISSVVLIDYRHRRFEATPRRSMRSCMAIITPRIETGEPALKIPLTLFPEVARREFVRLLRPEEWESGT